MRAYLSRTSAPTPVLIRAANGFQIILGKVRPITSPGREPSTSSDHCSSGGTDHVWFYDVQADGFSLDDKRTPAQANDLSDVLARWAQRDIEERVRDRSEQSFSVTKADIAAQGYDLSLNRYQKPFQSEVEQRPPLEIIADLEKLEDEIQQGLADLRTTLS